MTMNQFNHDDYHLLIVSDSRLWAEATGTTLCEHDLFISYEHTRCGEEHAHLRKTNVEPHVVLLDACSFSRAGELFARIRRLTEQLPESQFVVLASTSDPVWVTGCIEAGASSFVLKTEPLSDLVHAIKAMKNGHARCCHQVLEAVLTKIRELSGTKSESANNTEAELTEREIEILQLVEEGLLNKEISRRLGIALSTVKNHLHSAFEKLQVTSRRQAVSQAIALGVLKCQADYPAY